MKAWCTCVAISYWLLWRLITQGKQVRLINNAVFWLVSCGLLKTTNGTCCGEHEQKAQRSQSDSGAITRLWGHITARRTCSGTASPNSRMLPLRPEWMIYKRLMGCWVAIFQRTAYNGSHFLHFTATALRKLTVSIYPLLHFLFLFTDGYGCALSTLLLNQLPYPFSTPGDKQSQ